MLGGMLQGREQQWVATKDETTNTWRILNTWHDSLKSMDVEDDIPDDSPAVNIITEGAFIALFREAARLGVLENASFGTDDGTYEIELQDRETTIRELRTQLEQKQTLVEAKPLLSEGKAFKLEIADRMMKLAGLDGVSDITSN
tara:strand:+ start:714 stop:1145 length:432 start_codon:yes stop_codon:yes gene_type:complete